MIRYLFGFSGDALINGATTAEAQRSPPDEIQAYLETPEAGMALSARARGV
jgi:hypothetical protein